MNKDLLDKVTALAKRRGFIFPGSEAYGGLANSWDYGPLGVELKNNIKQIWWKRYVKDRGDIVGLDAALMMNSKVWEASGHLKEFSDPLVECEKCHKRFREDQIEEKCPECGGHLTSPKQFNMMFKTNLGPVESEDSTVYLRPETAQAMFVDFKNVLDTTRQTIPFGIAQIGKAFRNEITPGNYIFRTREFEQMEIEYFVKEADWEKVFEEWKKEMLNWMDAVGIDRKKVHEVEVPEEERAHYSKRTVDFEYEFPFGMKELYGLAYRTDFDLKNHEENSGENFKYRDPESGEEYWPHVVEPTWGVERTLLAVLLDAYEEDGDRVVLKLKPNLAPYKVAVFPLVKNKEKIVGKAKEIYDMLRIKYHTVWDDRDNIGKRYFSQDEIGTPYCITIDYDTLEDGTVTLRDRDTAEQKRVKIEDLEEAIKL